MSFTNRNPSKPLAAAAFLLLTGTTFSQESTLPLKTVKPSVSPHFREHMLAIGVGEGRTFEKDIFNTRGAGVSDPAKTNPALRVAYHYNLNESWSLGLIVHGYTHEFKNIITVNSEFREANFRLNTYNQGFVTQYYFSRGKFQPYIQATASIASGAVTVSVDSLEDGELEFEGFSAGGGAGALLVLSKYVGISVDGLLSFGSAEWEQKPFSNSADKSFSPSYWAVTVNLVALVPPGLID